MRPADRHNEIVKLVHKLGEMSVDDLADILSVSRETIRRDLSQLDGAGRIRKFHGGARIVSPAPADAQGEGPFALRMAENLPAKRDIARVASELFEAGDSLFIDTGTTTVILADILAENAPLVAITNSTKIAATIATNAGHTVFLIGGEYGADACEALGPLAIEQIRKFRARHAVLTVAAVDENMVMDFDVRETEIARAMIEQAEEVTILADSSKFGKRGLFEVAPLAAVTRLVTDQPPPPRLADALAAAGIRVIIASMTPMFRASRD